MAADPVAEAFSGFPWATMTRTGVDPMKPTEPCCDEPAFVCVSCGDDHKCDATTLRAALDGLVEAVEGYSVGGANVYEIGAARVRAALAAAKETP